MTESNPYVVVAGLRRSLSTRTAPRLAPRSASPTGTSRKTISAGAARVAMTADVLRAADAVVVLTDHDGIDYGLLEREARWVLDCRSRLSGPRVESL